MDFTDKIALVTGANRGIGLEIVRQLAEKGCRVILTARNKQSGAEKVRQFRDQGLDVIFQQLDVSSEADIKKISKQLENDPGRVDILINNAAIYIDEGEEGLTVSGKDMDQTMATNLMGPLFLCQTFVPLMKKNNYGRIINISSNMGAFGEMGGRSLCYRISKTALNAMTKILAAELRNSNILINSMSPGWVRTDMGGTSAPRSVAQGADTAVWLAALADSGPSGKFFYDRHEIPW